MDIQKSDSVYDDGMIVLPEGYELTLWKPHSLSDRQIRAVRTHDFSEISDRDLSEALNSGGAE